MTDKHHLNQSSILVSMLTKLTLYYILIGKFLLSTW